MAPREELLSDSDSDDGSPAARPTASRPKSKSAPPKSAKTAVQAGRARAAVASDDGMDSDASDEAGDDGRLQLVMHQLSKQVFACPRSLHPHARLPRRPARCGRPPSLPPSVPAEDHDAEEG